MSGLPLVPAASCPSAARALASAGLGPICANRPRPASSGASGAVGQAASSVVGFGANTVLDAIGSWVSSGAVWLLGQIGAVLGATTSIDLGASWFTAHYETMAALAGVVVLPLLLLGIVQSVYRQSAVDAGALGALERALGDLADRDRGEAGADRAVGDRRDERGRRPRRGTRHRATSWHRW